MKGKIKKETSSNHNRRDTELDKSPKVFSGSISTESSEHKQDEKNEVSSYSIFFKTIKRARNLIQIHVDESVYAEHHYDGFRAAIVLSISALDAYIRTLVIEKILKQLSESSKELPEKLKDYIKGLLNQDALLEAARKDQFNEKVEKAIRADFETKSFQGEYRIERYLELAGYKDIFEKISHSANKNRNRLQSDIEKYTKRRHIIAHCGDFDMSQIPPKEMNIDKEYAKSCIETVTVFAEHLYLVTKQ